jgi:hypothetical protein
MRLRSTSASRTRSQSPHAASAAAIRDLKVARSPLARAGRAGRRTRTAGARHQRPPAAGPEALGRDGNRRRPHASAGPPTRMKSRASQLAGGGFRLSPRRRSRAVRTRMLRRAVCRRSQQISVSGFCRNAVASAQNRSMAPVRTMTSCTATRTRIIPRPSSLAPSSAPAQPRSSARRWPAAHDPPRNCVDREPRGRCPPAAGAAAGAGDGGLDADVWCRSPNRGVPAESRRGTGRGSRLQRPAGGPPRQSPVAAKGSGVAGLRPARRRTPPPPVRSRERGLGTRRVDVGAEQRTAREDAVIESGQGVRRRRVGGHPEVQPRPSEGRRAASIGTAAAFGPLAAGLLAAPPTRRSRPTATSGTFAKDARSVSTGCG